MRVAVVLFVTAALYLYAVANPVNAVAECEKPEEPVAAPDLPDPVPTRFLEECEDVVGLVRRLQAGMFQPSDPAKWDAVADLRWEATRPVHPAAEGDGRCDFERVPASELAPSEFKEHFLERKPVIIVNATDVSEFVALTSKRVLLYCYGDFDVTLSTANKNSYAKYEAAFRHYVAQLAVPQPLEASGVGTKYFFGDNRHGEWEALFRHYRKPSQYIWSFASLSFGVGSSGSGVPFHTHGHVFAEVMHGRKRWFLQAPGPEPRFDPDESSLRWAVNVLPTFSEAERSKVMDCVCGPGDTIYIPSHWHHATLNLGETVFMSTFV